MDRTILWDRTRIVAGALFVFAVALAAINLSSASDVFQKSDILLKNQGSITDNKFDEYLRELVNTQGSKVNIPVVIIFKEQPAHMISSKVKTEFKDQFDEITKPAKGIYGRIKPGMLREKRKNISELLTLENSLLTEEEKAVLKDTGQKLDSKTRDMRFEILNRTVPIVDGIQAPIIEKITAKGGSVKYSSKILNAIAADIPVSYIIELSEEQTVYRIYYDHVLNATLDISTQAMGANTWWSNGYNGSAMDAAVIDTGIDGTHPALQVDYARVFHDTGEHNILYADNSSNPDDLQGHGTHVAGIIASTDPTYRGAGYGIDKLINAKSGWRGTDGGGYMYWSDGMKAINWSIFGNVDDADVISLSFGGGATNGNAGIEYFLDAIAYDLDISVAVAAGNNGLAGSFSVGEPAGAYNIISVGNVYDVNTVSRTNDYLISSSSRGPTLDGRIKPDISAPGTYIMSANKNWETDSDFIDMSGTSMAAPQITGSILLIMDYKNIRWQPEAIKALLLNTAEDKGVPGPDYDYGFGYVDMSNAYLHRDDVFTGSIANLPNGSVEKFYKGPAFSGDKATLVWNRHVTYNGPNDPTSYLSISDLDLYMYNESNGTQISLSTSGNNNVEQVKSNANYDSVILKIDPYGTFPTGIGLENYAIATDGTFLEVVPPILNLNVSNPENVNRGESFILNITVNNSGGISAHNVNVNITLPSGFSFISGANPQAIGTINAVSSKTASWVVKAAEIDPSALYVLDVSASSQSYDEAFSGQGNSTIWIVADEFINGTVLSNGTGISGVVVTANASISTITNISGFYYLLVPAGTYDLTATREPDYYLNNSVVVTAISGTTVVQDIELIDKPTGNIIGSVTIV